MAWSAFDDRRYDEALGILESSGQDSYEPKQVRDKVREHLTRRRPTLDKHLILARLADLDKECGRLADLDKECCRLADLDKECGRLVTTNFDHFFEKAVKKLHRQEGSKYRLAMHVAPALPPAKPQTFRGLAYLHGKLGDSSDNRQLVLTTADFGTAYMVEGWARRFSVDLFRHYHVVFIGYSVEDIMMRYLVSALAAVREESSQQFKKPYAFAKKGLEEQEQQEQQWSLKGIEPLLYDAADQSDEHGELWRVLKDWADDHRQGLMGRKQRVSHLGRFPPLPTVDKDGPAVRNMEDELFRLMRGEEVAADEDDPAVRDMAWALKRIEVAKYFADLKGDSRPHPGWIAHLQKNGFLGLTDDTKPVAAPLVSKLLTDCLDLHGVTRELSRWIVESLDTQEALDWALREGGVLHVDLRKQIRFRLGNAEFKLRPAFRKIWQVLADDGYAHALSEKHQAARPFSVSRLAPDAVFAKQVFLTRLRPLPVFKIKEDSIAHILEQASNTPRVPDRDCPADWCEIDIELIGIQSESENVERFQENAEDWEGALASMADDLTTRLCEAMDWLREFDLAAPDWDLTYSRYPSISPHEQNQHLPTWTQLIKLTQESYDALIVAGDNDNDAAARLVRRWRSLPYPVFRRLALYAATGGRNA